MRSFSALRRGGDFSRMRRFGRRVTTAALTVFLDSERRGHPMPLVGLAVGRSVGNAVVRNRVRRRIAAALHERLIGSPPRRILVVAQPAAASTPFGELAGQLERALGRAAK